MGYSPWDELAGMPDITICVAELGDETLGWWDGATRTLALNKRQSQRQMRCTLAHELEHAKRGDECGVAMSSVLAVRQEIAASARAARHLISMNDLISALLWSQDERELAEELHVDEDTLRIRLITLTPEEHQLIDERIWAAEEQIA